MGVLASYGNAKHGTNPAPLNPSLIHLSLPILQDSLIMLVKFY